MILPSEYDRKFDWNLSSREAILEVLTRAKRPVGVPEIMTALAKRHVVFNKTTIYREIEKLKVAGEIREVYFRNDKALYERTGDHHHHLVCVDCGDVRRVRICEHFADAERRMARRERFTILEHSLEFFGRCAKCRSMAMA